MNKTLLNAVIVGALTLSTLPLAYAGNAVDSDGDGYPDITEPLLSLDPALADTDGDGLVDGQDPKPTRADRPWDNTGPASQLVIETAKVEDNFDPVTRKDVGDHFELAIRNAGSSSIEGLQLYYTVTDVETGETESYRRNFSHFRIDADATRRLHLDNDGTPDFNRNVEHFRANRNSVLYRSTNAKTLTIEVRTGQEAAAVTHIKKDAGGQELAD